MNAFMQDKYGPGLQDVSVPDAMTVYGGLQLAGLGKDALAGALSKSGLLANEAGAIFPKDMPALKSWLGKSKVLDEAGNPKMVYHGTDQPFTKFSNDTTPGGLTWFTSDPEKASAFAERKTGNIGSNVKPLFAKIENPAGWDEYEKYGIGQLESMGHDGVILKDPDGSMSGFVLNNKQLKSAVGNSGKFNPRYSDITK